MDWFSGVIVYLLIWWVMIFCILPLRLNNDKEIDDAQKVSEGIAAAPNVPMVKKKMLIVTMISAFIWVVIYLLISADIISFREIAGSMIEKDFQ